MYVRKIWSDVATAHLKKIMDDDQFDVKQLDKPLQNNANPHILNSYGDSLLHIFADNFNGTNNQTFIHYMAMLIDHYGVNANIKNKNNLTPLQCLMNKPFFHIDVAMCLILRNAHINLVNNDGDSILLLVIKNKVPSVTKANYKNIILTLLKYNADIQQCDKKGFSGFIYLQSYTGSSDAAMRIALGMPTNNKVQDKKLISDNDLTLSNKVGDGKTSIVYKGTWKNSKVAIKVMDYDFETLSVYNNEIKLMSKLDSLNSIYFVHFYGYSISQNSYNIVMELVSNGDLRELITREDIEWGDQIKLMYHTSSAVQLMHNAEIIHHDLKPENILVNTDYTIKLCDFGYAQLNNNKLGLVGTAGYVAPEHLGENKLAYTKSSDIFSMGTIFWEIAHCRTAYFQLENEVITKKNISGIQEEIDDDCNPEVSAIIKNCWEKDYNKRQSAEQITQRISVLMH